MDTFIFTCEHGGNEIPQQYQPMFRECEELLDSHRGYDPGAIALARAFAGSFSAPVVTATVSRLLVDLNRSIGHPHHFSEMTRSAPSDTRARIINDHYRPYRGEVEQLVEQAVAAGHRVVHISSHSFTPVLGGEIRRADVGLLYDPRRPGEFEMCGRWKVALSATDPELRVRRNYPYAGKGDGFTTHLRKRFASTDYLGIEVEVNQNRVLLGEPSWKALRDNIIGSLHVATQTLT